MFTRRLSLAAFAALFALSSSLAMLQSARPALADRDDHHPKAHHQHWNNGNHNGPNKHGSQYGWNNAHPDKANRHDRDDRRPHHNHANANGNWNGNPNSYNGGNGRKRHYDPARDRR